MLTDCPTSLSSREANCLKRYARGLRVIEAGSLLGGSTIQLAKVATNVISIDKHSGYTTPTFKRFKSNLLRAGISHRVDCVVGDVLEELPKVSSDFTFLDLTGDYELTRKALQVTNSPLIGIHDFGRAHCGGVERAISELGYQILEHVDTLVICRKT